ncbi:MAG: FliH/SctL family protein, partial [Proteobacteria bacterium]|nr:FliH/SctL family protein [Pseudomonadota bacterium]
YPDAANRSVSKKSDAKASMPEDSSKIDQPLQATAPINVQPTDLKSLSISPEQEGIGVDALESLARPISIVKEPYSQKIVAETELRSKLTPLQKESESEFIALETTNRDLTAKNDVQNVEDQAINTYRNRAELESQNAALLEEIKLAAKSDGYNEGFRLGEEKGVLAGQHTAGEIFKRVTELIHEFEGLKGSVLGNIQQNFYELSQAVAESLLEREFSISPSAFAKVLEKVLKDTVSDNEFKIKLHPDTWQKVTDLKIPNFEGHLVKDPSILVGEFKVESNLTVVDGNAKKIVAQMLQNVDMNLFEDSKIAG